MPPCGGTGFLLADATICWPCRGNGFVNTAAGCFAAYFLFHKVFLLLPDEKNLLGDYPLDKACREI
jgi:hypothetical protein